MTTARPAGLRSVPPLNPGKPASTYARFIPREELGAFAAWSPNAFGSAPGAPAPGTASAPPPKPKPAPPPPPAGPSADEVRAQVSAARQAGYQDGYRDGLVALESFKQSHNRQVGAQLGALLQSLGEQMDGLEQQMAQAVAHTAVLLARQVLRQELRQHPQQVAALAEQAVATVLLSARHISLRLNPQDHALVAEGAAEVLAARQVRLLPSADIARGGCVVESDLGHTDARIETRWQQAASLLDGSVPWQPAPDEAAEAGAAAPAAEDNDDEPAA